MNEESKFDVAFKFLMNKKQKDIDAGKIKTIRDISSQIINGKQTCTHEFKCEKFTYMQQGNSKEKYFILERWNRIKINGKPAGEELKVGDIEYRFSYYIISRKPNSKRDEKWMFGQFSPLIGHEDLFSLLELAKFEKTIL